MPIQHALCLAFLKIFDKMSNVGIAKHFDNLVEYNLIRKIAEGGMGIVYEGCQHGLGQFQKRVAIKVIREEYSSIKEFRNNFIGEARLVADLIHTNIVQIYNLGQVNDQYFMVMEFVNGINLEDFLIKHLEIERYVPLDFAVFIISRICRGLFYAHNKKDRSDHSLHIVHRDVSPRNIMISLEGDVKITDFGIAKARDIMYNKEGKVIAGKPEYLSPEQANREITDLRADLFSCGIILSELILGYNIFEGSDEEATLQNIKTLEVPYFSNLNAQVDPKLNEIMHKMLQRKRVDRYQSALEILCALESYLYKDKYGPTNEKLALYTQELLGLNGTYAK